MKRFVIYARYSTDLQKPTSIEDQFYTCEEHVKRQGGIVVARYADAGISGTTTERPQYQKMMQDMATGTFDILLSESMDRLSRDPEHSFALWKAADYYSIGIVTLSQGPITPLTAGFSGIISREYVRELALKVRRGIEGRIRAGKRATTPPFGYRIVKRVNEHNEYVKGETEINPDQAVIVQRIFEEFAAGKSPRKIAYDLNKEGIPGPRGKKWYDVLIRGDANHGTGVLNTSLYIGKRYWGRKKAVRNPFTQKKNNKLTPQKEWICIEVPELAFISENLWKSVKARQEEIRGKSKIAGAKKPSSNRLNEMRRPKHLLSGLITCGECGANMVMAHAGRFTCSAAVRGKGCPRVESIKRDELTGAVLAGLRDQILSKDRFDTFLREYISRQNVLLEKSNNELIVAKKKLIDLQTRESRIIDAIERGINNEATKARLEELQMQKAQVNNVISRAQSNPIAAIPNRENYLKSIMNIGDGLTSSPNAYKSIDEIRPLIDKVVAIKQSSGWLLRVSGNLSRMLQGVTTDQKFFEVVV